MPYITQDKKDRLDKLIDALVKEAKEVGSARIEGILNYCFTKVLLRCVPKTSYVEINKVIGVLECCKLEFYRRLAGPYEDWKARENGDVYKKVYAITDEDPKGGWIEKTGLMTDGLYSNLERALEEVGTDNDMIFEMSEDTSTLLYAWDSDSGKWVEASVFSRYEKDPRAVAQVVTCRGGDDPPKQKVYAIGTETSPGAFGMHHGPTPNLKEMLDVYGVDNDVLFEFVGEQSEPLYGWDSKAKQWLKTVAGKLPGDL
jgi:hypothetical protein